MPYDINNDRNLSARRAPGWLPLTGFSLILVGACVTSGWASHRPLLVGLIPGFPPMVLNTALMFIVSGSALLALSQSRLRAVGYCGAAVGILASLILAEHLTGLDLGIDGRSVHAWAQDGFPNPGRSSPITALCFTLVAVTLILLAAGRPAGLKLASWLTLTVLIVSVGVGFGHVLKLDALYVSYALRGMAIPTAASFFVLSLSLYRAISRRRGLDLISDDRRIVSVGIALLVVVALATGLPVFFVVKSHIEDTIGVGLRTGLDIEVQLLDTIVTLRSQRAAIITNRPNAIATLRAVHRDPDDQAARELLKATVESFRPHGFSAMRIALPDGRVMAASGQFVTEPGLVMPLDSYPEHELLWDDDYYLRSRFHVKDGDVEMAVVDMEQPMPQIAQAINGASALGQSGELQVCKRSDGLIRCLPSRRNPEPLEIQAGTGTNPLLVSIAALGGHGLASGRDEHGRQVIGAYAPLATHGLFAVLKLDTAELYRPLRQDLERSLGLAALVVLLGSLLFHATVKPLAKELVHARELSRDRSEAMERLHSFQRAVFAQAPDGILVASEQGQIIEANERMATLFGYPREVLSGMSVDALVPEPVRDRHRVHRDEFGKAPSTRVMSPDRTLKGRRSDGTEFPIEVALAPMSTPEGHRVIAIVKDVSEARAAEALLREVIREKELLLGEIHHRVKNNLQIVHSLLDMQAGLTVDVAAASALRDSQNRIQSMALIHQTLYQSRDFGKVDFGQFLETLTGHLQASYGRPDLGLHSHAENVRLSIDRAIPCGLIVNELVTNALKHGFPARRGGRIDVELRMQNHDRIEVAVTDDGVGIPDAVDLGALPSLGMQLVQVLTEQLQAQLHIQRRNPTRISLVFPLN